MSIAFFWLFLVMMAVGIPVVFVLLLAPGISLFLDGKMALYPQILSRLYNGMYSFPLMAIPFFILAGELMNSGGITRSLVLFAQSLIGHVRGGLAQVNILSSILFAGLSGSAVADTSALGSMLIPAMEKQGYSRRFAAAVTAASSVIGPIIPPSGIMIIYAFIIKEVSPAGLFAAGIVPGLMVGIGLMLVTSYLAKKRNYPVAARKATWTERGRAAKAAFWPLLTPVIILGGILGGIFTPTEAAGAAAGYALILSLFVLRTVTFRELPAVLFRAAMASGVIMLLVGAAVAFAWVVTISGAPGIMTRFVLSISDNPYILLFLINLLLLFIGMFLDAGPAILILGPILSPIMAKLGVEPLHFAIVMCVNVTVGLATPPMGLVLFTAASISREKAEAIAIEMLPFLAVEIGVIFLITFIPALSLTVPRLVGFA
ncbi:MAG: TRAP transporter large permease [Geminicoccaceae bacterium]